MAVIAIRQNDRGNGFAAEVAARRGGEHGCATAT